MSDKKEFAQIVMNILKLMKWKQITSHLGMMEAKQYLKIVKCFVENVTEENPEYKRANKLLFFRY